MSNKFSKPFLINLLIASVLSATLGVTIISCGQAGEETPSEHEYRKKAEEAQQANQMRRQAAEQAGDFDIDVMTFGELKRLSRLEPKISDLKDGSVYSDFGDGVIEAKFFGATSKIDDSSRLFSVSVNEYFRGTVRGVRFDDTIEEARKALKKKFPNAKVEPNGEFWSATFEKNWRMGKNSKQLTLVDGNVRYRQITGF